MTPPDNLRETVPESATGRMTVAQHGAQGTRADQGARAVNEVCASIPTLAEAAAPSSAGGISSGNGSA